MGFTNRLLWISIKSANRLSTQYVLGKSSFQ